MALIVEDGTGLPLADSYCSVAEASAYFTARGNEAWADVENKEAALRKATDYMLAIYHGRWKGYRATVTQRLDWPRRSIPLEDAPAPWSFLAETVVPPEVKNACAELALLSNTADLMPNLERAKSSVTVGEVSVTYDPSSPESVRYRYIDSLVARYLRTVGLTARVVRT